MTRSFDLEADLANLIAHGVPAAEAETLMASDMPYAARDLRMTVWDYFVATAEDGDRTPGVRFDPTKTAAENAAMVTA